MIYRISLLSITFVVIFFLGFISANAQTLFREQSQTTGSNYSVSIESWTTDGKFRMFGGPPEPANNKWELTHPLDGNIIEAKVTLGIINSPQSISLSLGGGTAKKGTIVDTDWDANSFISDKSLSTSKADLIVGAISTEYKFSKIKVPFDLFGSISYSFFNIDADYRDATIVVDNYNPVNISAQGKWQVYNLGYSGLEFGARARKQFIQYVSGEVGLDFGFVSADYRGTRYPNTNITQYESIFTTGWTLGYRLNLNFNYERLQLQAGYRFKTYRTKGKDERGTDWSGSWERLDSDLKGISLACGLRF